MRALPYCFAASGVAAALALCACAPTEPNAAAQATNGEPVDTVCFTSGLMGFSQLGENMLLLKQSPGQSYAAKLGFCPNAKAAEGLKIDSPDQCLKRGDKLLVFDTQFPRQNTRSDKPDQCVVLELTKLR